MSTALLIVDHGSRSPEANGMLECMAGLLSQMRPGLIVHFAHMEIAHPTVQEGYAACVRDGATKVIVQPYMLSPGTHATTSIPALFEQAAAEYPHVTSRVTDPLGFHEKLAEVVLERAGIT